MKLESLWPVRRDDLFSIFILWVIGDPLSCIRLDLDDSLIGGTPIVTRATGKIPVTPTKKGFGNPYPGIVANPKQLCVVILKHLIDMHRCHHGGAELIGRLWKRIKLIEVILRPTEITKKCIF